MSEKTKMGLWIFGLPFVISASMEFLPLWLSFPILLLGTMQWLGACASLSDLNKEEK